MRKTKINRRDVMGYLFSTLLIMFVLLALCAWPIAYLPHYEKNVYEKSQNVTWERYEQALAEATEEDKRTVHLDFVGYPTEGMKTELTSFAQFLEESSEPICLEIDVEDLKPTGMYTVVRRMETGFSGASVHSKWTPRSSGPVITQGINYDTECYLETLWNRPQAIYGQYYLLRLADGNEVLVLLNDTALEIPRNGKWQLPFASKRYLALAQEDEDYIIDKLGIQTDSTGDIYYLDASEWWATFEDGLDELKEFRIQVMVGCLLTGIGGAIVVFILMLVVPIKDKKEDTLDETL
nr:hypothetical protein [Eubacterium sp.]